MYICESIFNDPDLRQPEFSMEEVDFFTTPFFLTLRKNLSTREYELINRTTGKVLTSSPNFNKILAVANELVQRHHPHSTPDLPCLHYGTQKDASCKMFDEHLERFLCVPIEGSLTELELSIYNNPVDEAIYSAVINKFTNSSNPIIQEFVVMYAQEGIQEFASKIIHLCTDLKVLVRELSKSVDCQVVEAKEDA